MGLPQTILLFIFNSKTLLMKNNIQSIIYKSILLILLISTIVLITDKLGIFNPDYTNDHTRRKWNTFYEFVEKNPIDIVLIGNSHLYTGINPQNLSNRLGANCFILASPGTTLTDSYFALKEAIKVSKPKIAIIETFTINDYESHKLKDGTLSDQFKSFSARKDIITKLISTPILFEPSNYFSAWSNTIRNHRFIFTDTEQIKQNKFIRTHSEKKDKELYLGRYIRFTSGLEKENLDKYENPEFIAYDYAKHLPSKEAKLYLEKTIALCEEENIKLLFVTLPMYFKHVHNYEAYKKSIQTIIGDKPMEWIDLQANYDTLLFGPESFENTVAENQHMTYQGSIIAAVKIADYIRQEYRTLVPNRKNESKWRNLFYASDGYFANNPITDDGNSKLLLRNTKLTNQITINEVGLVPFKTARKLLVKVEKDNAINTDSILFSTLSEMNGKQFQVELAVKKNKAFNFNEYFLFESEPFNSALSIKNIIKVTI